jgi:hypothetical protein
MTRTEKKIAVLSHMANRFYQEAEAPDGTAWSHVFLALARRDVKALEKLCVEHGVLTHND